MYHGEVSVEEEELPALLDFAKALKVKGLVKDDDKMMVSSSNVNKTNKSNCSNGSGPPAIGKVWTVSESKLTGIQPKETNGEEDQGAGTLVIDEESNDIPVEADLEISEDTPPGPGMVKTIGPNGKVEWKRYKQYTKDDILAAIEEVKNGMIINITCEEQLGIYNIYKNKNYYVVRNAGCGHSRYTLKLYLIFFNQ